ncbi:MAG: hypothetical protein ACLR7Z_10540 [Bilophila wadsworthia]
MVSGELEKLLKRYITPDIVVKAGVLENATRGEGGIPSQSMRRTTNTAQQSKSLSGRKPCTSSGSVTAASGIGS